MPSHAGQISLPGGGPRPEDDGPIATALREAEEEVGIARDHVDVLGTFGTHLGGLRYAVTPVIGLVREDADLAPCPREVAEIFEVPLGDVLDRTRHRTSERRAKGTTYRMFALPLEAPPGTPRDVWGLTAGILDSFAAAFSESGGGTASRPPKHP